MAANYNWDRKIASSCRYMQSQYIKIADQRYLHRMNETFELPVIYNDEELLFPAQLRHLGYTHVFIVDVAGTEIYFEPDEERHYRAMIDPEKTEGNNRMDVALLQTIASTIESILK